MQPERGSERAVLLRGAPRWKPREHVPIGMDGVEGTFPAEPVEPEDGATPVRGWLVEHGKKLMQERAREHGYFVGLRGGIPHSKSVRPYFQPWMAGFDEGTRERERRIAAGLPVPSRLVLPFQNRIASSDRERPRDPRTSSPHKSEPGGTLAVGCGCARGARRSIDAAGRFPPGDGSNEPADAQ